jgi:hypothetical protein
MHVVFECKVSHGFCTIDCITVAMLMVNVSRWLTTGDVAVDDLDQVRPQFSDPCHDEWFVASMA